MDKMLQPAILQILYDEDLHGFMIIKKLSDNAMFNGMEPDRTGVYRYLRKMETSGLLTARRDEERGKARIIYSITEEGKQCLDNWSMVLKQYIVSMVSFVKALDDTLQRNRG